MGTKKKTDLNDLDEALAVLNAARRTFNPDNIWIHFEDGGFSVDDFGGNLPVEFDRALGLIQYAASFANKILDGRVILEDHRGRWVAMPAA